MRKHGGSRGYNAAKQKVQASLHLLRTVSTAATFAEASCSNRYRRCCPCFQCCCPWNPRYRWSNLCSSYCRLSLRRRRYYYCSCVSCDVSSLRSDSDPCWSGHSEADRRCFQIAGSTWWTNGRTASPRPVKCQSNHCSNSEQNRIRTKHLPRKVHVRDEFRVDRRLIRRCHSG